MRIINSYYQQSKWIHFNTKVKILRNNFLKISISVLILQLKYSRWYYKISTALSFCLTAVCLTIDWTIHDCNLHSFQNIDPCFKFYDRVTYYDPIVGFRIPNWRHIQKYSAWKVSHVRWFWEWYTHAYSCHPRK